MRRKRWLRGVEHLASSLLLVIGCEAGVPSRPDVILITLDTTRVDHLGVYGYSRNLTPETDRFAADAVLYRRAWSTSSWTLPAHASMFTGKNPTSHGAHFNMEREGGDAKLAQAFGWKRFRELRFNKLGEREVTLAELLAASGYETAAFVAGPFLSPVFGLLQGYGVQDAEIRSAGGRGADEVTDRAIGWIRAVPSERPVHVLVNYFDPHRPYSPPPGYDDLPFAKLEVPISDAAVIEGRPLSGLQRRALVDRYDGEIRFMDHHLGRLLGALREVGRYDDALIIVVSDHGETFGEHGLMEHGRWLYEEVLRVALLIRYPGGRGAGTEEDDPVSVVDLLPLVARQAGLELPSDVEGVPIGRRKLVLAESYRGTNLMKRYASRFDRDLVAGIRWPWKLILSDNAPPELYRLNEDPEELRNLARESMEEDLRRDLEAARAALRPPASVSAPENVSPETREQLRSLGYIE